MRVSIDCSYGESVSRVTCYHQNIYDGWEALPTSGMGGGHFVPPPGQDLNRPPAEIGKFWEKNILAKSVSYEVRKSHKVILSYEKNFSRKIQKTRRGAQSTPPRGK